MKKYIQQIIEGLKGLLKNESGELSSKRFLALTGGISLIVYAFIYPSDYSNSSVLLMVLTMAGVNGMEKIFKKDK